MPDTPIDQSAGIQSIRLKVPTGTVPIPPVGFGQLHSPSPGTLAIRMPDGSVVPVGGGGGSPTTLENERGLVTVEQVGVEPQAITIYPKPESNGQIKLAGSVIDALNQPQAPDAVTLVLQGGAPPAAATGRRLVWADSAGRLRSRIAAGNETWAFFAGAQVRVTLDLGGIVLRGTTGEEFDVGGGDISLNAGGSSIGLFSDGQVQITPAGPLLLLGLPTVDPHTDGALWIAPITRQLMVSAG